MSEQRPKRKVREFSAEDLEHGLLALVVAGGSASVAARYCKQHYGLTIPANTLQVWMNRHRDRYLALFNEHAQKIAERMAAEAEELVGRIAEAEREATELVVGQFQALAARLAEPIADDADDFSVADRLHLLDKASSIMRNLSVSKSLQLDKVASPLRGRPTVITQGRSAEEILRGLKALAPGLVIDSTAEDVTPAQLPEGT